jgi:hypothetical protein
MEGNSHTNREYEKTYIACGFSVAAAVNIAKKERFDATPERSG